VTVSFVLVALVAAVADVLAARRDPGSHEDPSQQVRAAGASAGD
jgi:hypothetical protein